VVFIIFAITFRPGAIAKDRAAPIPA